MTPRSASHQRLAGTGGSGAAAIQTEMGVDRNEKLRGMTPERRRGRPPIS